MNRFLRGLLLILTSSLLAGCTVRHGDFTVISNKALRLSEFELDKAERARGVVGEDVLHIDEVHDGTPAANVPGLRSGLCLRSVNGTPASTFSQTDLLEALSARPVTLIFYDPESEEGEPPPAFAEGDRATVIDDVALCRRLADGHGGWADGMEAYCGDTGTVMVVDEDGDVSLQFADGEDWTWNPAALRRAPDAAAPPLHPRRLAQARVDDAPPGEDAGPASATHLFARTRFVRTKLLS